MSQGVYQRQPIAVADVGLPRRNFDHRLRNVRTTREIFERNAFFPEQLMLESDPKVRILYVGNPTKSMRETSFAGRMTGADQRRCQSRCEGGPRKSPPAHR